MTAPMERPVLGLRPLTALRRLKMWPRPPLVAAESSWSALASSGILSRMRLRLCSMDNTRFSNALFSSWPPSSSLSSSSSEAISGRGSKCNACPDDAAELLTAGDDARLLTEDSGQRLAVRGGSLPRLVAYSEAAARPAAVCRLRRLLVLCSLSSSELWLRSSQEGLVSTSAGTAAMTIKAEGGRLGRPLTSEVT